MCEGHLCQFWPPSGDSLCKRDIQKCIPLTTPLTKNFFEYRTNMCISCYWSMCMHSTWSVTLSGVCIYILGPILPYFIFQQCVNYARDSHFHDMIVYLGVKYEKSRSPWQAPAGQWLTKYSVFTFWHTSLAMIHGLQSLKVHIFSLFSI